ncbi:hypothetical protein DEIPH_ctg079orf0017 [Deinococcus phoenicis]|uniref:DUF2239 domain-containing protein n=1 Tax=Deinococcus phoenicis TaxID=1476583 RepID=A0A016QKY6_9DEIO|nr:DUF2239 family protein [Deinococcus phoenicis]EYB66636.1 hypothetical protein DEIPH_ctg079orf0017 [Deinococcus phoenicis]
MEETTTYTAFHGHQRLATGELRPLLTQLKAQQEQLGAHLPLLIFEDRTGRQVDFNLRGTLEEVLEREAPLPRKAGPGRPKLGIVSREVSLLPRHWAWLEEQPSGASAALRRLIDEARKQNPEQERVRQAQAAADRFLGVMAGDLPGFEAASRALYARDLAGFREHSQPWPEEIRAHALYLAAPAFGPETAPAPPQASPQEGNHDPVAPRL